MNARLIARYAFREILGWVCMAAALFWSAGRLDWWAAWGALAVMLAWIVGTAAVILRIHPDLLAERLGPRKGSQRWDTLLMSAVGMLQLGRYILAGLDQRYGWTGSFPLSAQILALVICFLAYALVVWATASNAYFSQIVRLQPERGQTVVTGGPYHTVRHPAYAGALIYELAVGILLASWWALLAGGLTAALLIVRTALEDRYLQAALPGYAAYARQVRYRLFPAVW
ncbi:MAG: isoprenylcysteine carboxylmethyltransferase family protein [Anaerolineaceae bacterium]